MGQEVSYTVQVSNATYSQSVGAVDVDALGHQFSCAQRRQYDVNGVAR